MDALWINVKYIARVIQRFTLQTTKRIPEAIPFLRLVVPVTNIDEILEDLEILTYTITAGAGTGWLEGYTVPDTDRIILYGYDISRTTGTTAEHSSFAIKDAVSTTNLNSHTAGAQAVHLFPTPIPMERGWKTALYISTGNLNDVFTLYHLIKRVKSWTTES